MVDVKRIKVGDQILLRSRDVKTVTEVNHRDDDTFPVSVFWGTSCGMVTYTRDGFYWDDREENYRDILEIIPAETSEKPAQDKMTLRDQFAMTALSGLLSNHQSAPFSLAFDSEEAAKSSYKIADKMMKVRKENN